MAAVTLALGVQQSQAADPSNAMQVSVWVLKVSIAALHSEISVAFGAGRLLWSHTAWMSAAHFFRVIERLSIWAAPVELELPEQTGAEMLPPAASARRRSVGLKSSCLALFFPPFSFLVEILLSCFSKLATLFLSMFMALTAMSTHVVERQVEFLAFAAFILFSWFFLFLSPFFFFCLLSAFFLFLFFLFLSPFFFFCLLSAFFLFLFFLLFCPFPPFWPFRPFLLLDLVFLFLLFLLFLFLFFAAFLCPLPGSASLANLARPDSKLSTWFSSSGGPAAARARQVRPMARTSRSLFIWDAAS